MYLLDINTNTYLFFILNEVINSFNKEEDIVMRSDCELKFIENCIVFQNNHLKISKSTQ